MDLNVINKNNVWKKNKKIKKYDAYYRHIKPWNFSSVTRVRKKQIQIIRSQDILKAQNFSTFNKNVNIIICEYLSFDLG